jgi:hypothetical protein
MLVSASSTDRARPSLDLSEPRPVVPHNQDQIRPDVVDLDGDMSALGGTMFVSGADGRLRKAKRYGEESLERFEEITHR